MRIGYLVEYSEKTSLFFQKEPGDNISERKEVICSKSKLIELLQNESKYIIWNTRWVNADDYQLNHPDNRLEEWGF